MLQYGLGSATARDYDLACEEAARITLQMWGLSDRLRKAEIERYRVVPASATLPQVSRAEESPPVAKRKAAEITSEPSECQQNTVALFHLFTNSVVTDKETPVFAFESLPGTKFSCSLRATINGRQIQVFGMGPSKIIAKREACFKVLR